ncbi:Uncharacterised protein [Vibrio cholerae]|nr:Uncharacterised protein [Vibrio cholerae]
MQPLVFVQPHHAFGPHRNNNVFNLFLSKFGGGLLAVG